MLKYNNNFFIANKKLKKNTYLSHGNMQSLWNKWVQGI